MSERDCKHGHLARSCEICDLEAERDELRAALRDIQRAFDWRRHAIPGSTNYWAGLRNEKGNSSEAEPLRRIDALIGPYDHHSVTRPSPRGRAPARGGQG